MTTNTTTTETYRAMAAIYNRNVNKIRVQFNSAQIAELKKTYGTTDANQLAKKLMLKGIEL